VGSGEGTGNGFYVSHPSTFRSPSGPCRAAGKLTKFRIKLAGWRQGAWSEIQPYDLTRGPDSPTANATPGHHRPRRAATDRVGPGALSQRLCAAFKLCVNPRLTAPFSEKCQGTVRSTFALLGVQTAFLKGRDQETSGVSAWGRSEGRDPSHGFFGQGKTLPRSALLSKSELGNPERLAQCTKGKTSGRVERDAWSMA